MHQEKLFFEGLEEAIRDTITALGGPKKVGHLMKPHLKPDAAGRWLNDCLNDARAEVMSFQQFLFLAELGRREGVHNIAVQFCREAGYADPLPQEPEDQAAQLMKEYIRAGGQNERIAKQMAQLAARLQPSMKAVG